MKKRLLPLAFVGIMLLGGCFNKSITREVAKSRAVEIKDYWASKDAEIPAKSVGTMSVIMVEDGERAEVITIEEYDRDAKFYHGKMTMSDDEESMTMEEWIFYNEQEQKTYTFIDIQGYYKDYEVVDGDQFKELVDESELNVSSLHRTFDLEEVFGDNVVHENATYRSKGAGNLYAKFDATLDNEKAGIEIDIEDYLIQKLQTKSSDSDYELNIGFKYGNFTITKPKVSDFEDPIN